MENGTGDEIPAFSQRFFSILEKKPSFSTLSPDGFCSAFVEPLNE